MIFRKINLNGAPEGRGVVEFSEKNGDLVMHSFQSTSKFSIFSTTRNFADLQLAAIGQGIFFTNCFFDNFSDEKSLKSLGLNVMLRQKPYDYDPMVARRVNRFNRMPRVPNKEFSPIFSKGCVVQPDTQPHLELMELFADGAVILGARTGKDPTFFSTYGPPPDTEG